MPGLPLDYAIRNLGRSPSRLLLTATGSGLVVALVIGAGGFVNGMQKALRSWQLQTNDPMAPCNPAIPTASSTWLDTHDEICSF